MARGGLAGTLNKRGPSGPVVDGDGHQVGHQADPALPVWAQPLAAVSVPSFCGLGSAHSSSDRRSELARERPGEGGEYLEEPKVLVDSTRIAGST